MKTWTLILLAISFHWDAQRSNPVNLFAAIGGMVINNSIVLFGLWAMLFSGKPDGEEVTLYFLTLNTVVTIAWGATCFFMGGFYSLAEFIEEGSLEPMLSSTRHPLLLVGISQSVLPALGDLIQGFCTLGVVSYLGGFSLGLKCFSLVGVSAIACTATFILTGSIPFYVTRGGQLASLIREICLALSFYPTGKVFDDRMRWALWLTPAAAVALMPMRAIENWGVPEVTVAVLSAVGLFIFAVLVFHFGLRRYQSANYIVARG